MAGRRQEPLDKLVAQLFREREKNPYLTVTLLRHHWPAILGPKLAARTYPSRVRNDTLWINATDASWAYQLQFMKGEILESIHVFTESSAIKDLHFRQGEIPAPVSQEAPESPGTEHGEGSGEEPAGTPREAPPKLAEVDGASGGQPRPAAEDAPAEPEPGPETIGDPSLRSAFARWRSGSRRKKTADGS